MKALKEKASDAWGRMKVAVDGYLFRHATRGMARFAKTLANGLGPDILTFEPSNSIDSEVYSHGSGKRPSFPYWEQWILPRLALANGVDVLLCPYNTAPVRLHTRIRLILVIHDLIFLDKSMQRSISSVQNIGRHYRRAVVPLVAKKAFHIVTVSEYSKQRIIAELGIPEFRITVIPNAIGEFWFERRKKTISDRPYILTVSGEAPSKNLVRLIQAFAHIHRVQPQIRLIVVGVKPTAHHYFQAVADSLGVGADVILTPFLSDDELKCLYQNAELYVCSSLAEGFGIPVLEAMAMGIPLACSDQTSMPEVCGEAACYFDPYDTRAISDVMINLLADAEGANRRVEIGKSRAFQFSEENVAIKVQEFWSQFGEYVGKP
jgi:glycosyltransferase involved in cell wall biosynthesis